MSLCTRRVLVVLAEKDVPFELQTVDFFHGEHKKSPYIDKQPFGVIPLLEDGTFTVYESRAVGRYIASKHRNQGAQLLPRDDDVEAQALFEQWASIEYSLFYVRAEKVLVHKWFNPSKGIPVNEEEAAVSVKLLKETFNVLEKVLEKQQYLAGENFSLIDAFYMPAMDYLHKVGDGPSHTEYPALHAWWQKVSSREAWERVLAYVGSSAAVL